VLAGLLAATSPMVVEYAAEGRMYGLALLATATPCSGSPAGSTTGGSAVGVGRTAAGLAHWFAVPVVAGLAVAALVLRRRRALPLLAVAVAAVLPTLGLVALVRVNGEGNSGFGWIRASGGELPLLAVQAWTGGGGVLLLALLGAVAVGVLRGQRTAAVVAGCWVGLPLAALTALELLRPVFVPRYLLPTLLGLAVLAAVGLARLPRWAVVGGTGLIVALQLVAVGDVLDRGPREDARRRSPTCATGSSRGRSSSPSTAGPRWRSSSTPAACARTSSCRRPTRPPGTTSSGCCASRRATGCGPRTTTRCSGTRACAWRRAGPTTGRAATWSCSAGRASGCGPPRPASAPTGAAVLGRSTTTRPARGRRGAPARS
jgi:hypothetical protein